MADHMIRLHHHPISTKLSRTLLLSGILALPIAAPAIVLAQAPAAPATANSSSVGTVKSIEGSTLTLTTDAGKPVTATVAPSARILQLAPGSKDLKTALPIALTDIAPGDRVLVTGKPGDTPDVLTVSRVVLMKSTDIAAQHASEEQSWKREGISGLVTAVTPSPAGPAFAVSAGPRKFTVQTSATTVFRRYAGDSVKFQDAKSGTPDEIHAGDQLSVRGPKSDDGATITAAEVVSGSFRNLSGLITAVDASTGTVTLKDLATKQVLKIVVTSNSDLRNLPAATAAGFLAREKAPATPPATPAAAPAAGGPPARHSAGMDLSQMLAHLPTQTIAELKPGEAVMIVASASQSGGLTAVTMLSGVEPILSATPSGSAPMTLSPWSVGGGAPEGGGGQ
jgi:hypothetical protein